MISLTQNEAKIINFLFRHFNALYSLRQLAKHIGISPEGASKIMKKLKEKGIVVLESSVTGKMYYKFNFSNNVALKLAELVLTQNELNPTSKVLARDMENLRNHTKACILYGSILTKGNKANDYDVMLMFEKESYKDVTITHKEISQMHPQKIHLMMQTEKDFIDNLKKRHPPLLSLFQTGAVLWGEKFIVEAVKNAAA
ncbi:winged helix-turn-helix transcriptional regulator [Candidatus Woesearchaeota archaeon]|nr:winged helix-turn-helix transcriptional regulator [Candidatus Woesearchaeota archaeon]